MDTQKQQIVESLKQANNVLVTVSNNPSVDQLAACIGLTLALNKMKKHATAVFSGAVPPIISFLEPEKTIEKTTDSLRDFIIAIDKAKADKLRYKVEDKFVKIFITPYRTSISEKDLEFSEGDFNVDVVLAVGVHKQADLDQAITAHGRILHDATVISINNQEGIELGSINLIEQRASSLSEIAVELLDQLDKSMVDSQIATTLLTGIVAETDRFRNAKTTPATMTISAELLAAGANQQLVASKLESAPPLPTPIAQTSSTSNEQKMSSADKPDDGTLRIDHNEGATKAELPVAPGQSSNDSQAQAKAPQIHIDENGQFHPPEERSGLSINPPVAPPLVTPPLPPVQPMAPAPGSFPPSSSTLPTPPASPSPLNPFALPPSAPAPGGQGLPPLYSPYSAQGMGSVPGTSVATTPGPVVPLSQQMPPLPPVQPMAPAPGSFPPSSSTLPTPPRQEVVPSVVTPAIIQPDASAVLAAQQGEEAEQQPIPLNNLPPTIHTEGPHLMVQPPTFGSQLNAGMMPDEGDEEVPSGTPMTLPPLEHPGALLDREPLSPQQPPMMPSSLSPPPNAQAQPMSLPPPPSPKVPPSPASLAPVPGGDQAEPPVLAEEYLSSLERDVKSPHLDYIESPVPNLPLSSPQPLSPVPMPQVTPVATEPSNVMQPAPAGDTSGIVVTPTYNQEEQAADVKSARDAISAAFQGSGGADEPALEPVASLNAQPLGDPLHEEVATNMQPPASAFPSSPGNEIPPPPPVPPPLIPPNPS